MWECFVDRLILRVNFGVNQARTPALVILRNKLNFTGNELTITTHCVSERITLLIVAIFIDVMGITIIGPAHICARIMRFQVPVYGIFSPSVVSFDPAEEHICRRQVT
ncbi:Uncharacterised protein [Klebsiella pneumoniae]|nr:Uncharacterised protein [Klebsiella pneumoniae]